MIVIKCPPCSSCAKTILICSTILILLAISLCLFYLAVFSEWTRKDYLTIRQEIIDAEMARQLGASLQLTRDERIANAHLMSYKTAQLDAAVRNPADFIPARHFFDTKAEFNESNHLFQILRAMPKGGVLHTHDTATTGWEYVYAQTWRPNLYFCNDTGQPARLHFFSQPDATCVLWRLLADIRATDPDFELVFKDALTLDRAAYQRDYCDLNRVWSMFQSIFILITGMLTYRPVFEEQFRTTLQQLYDDNVTYVEFRGTLEPVYELDGRAFKPEEVVAIYVRITRQFAASHPHFIGAKMIYAPLRNVDDGLVDEYLRIVRRVRTLYPDFIAGFDLVGQEDLGRPLLDFVDKLQGLGLSYFFHAGETNWYAEATDQNLLDAILLGTKRIGHGYALVKHPIYMEMVKERSIALEISPISNQVLCLVRDLRNHPAAVYLANNVPVVITNDDPTLWGTLGVSYDWYMAFLGMAARSADLRLLKALALNSLHYSAMTDVERKQATRKWRLQWDEFVQRLIFEY